MNWQKAIRVGCFAGLFWALGTSLPVAYTLYRSTEAPFAPLRWFTNTATFYIDATPPDELDPEAAINQIRESFEVWASLTCDDESYPFDFVYGGTLSGRPVGFDKTDPNNNENIVVWVKPPLLWEYDADAVAMTSLTYDTTNGQIVDADVELNDRGYVYSGNGGAGKVDLKNTLVHEVGHFLGLDHSQVPTATLFRKAPPGETKKRDLIDDDVAGYCALYGPNAPPLPEPPPNSSEPNGNGCAQASSPESSPISMLIVLFSALVLAVFRRAGYSSKRADQATPPGR
jgi:hypothetical protein